MWFRNRKQITILNNTESSSVENKYGLRQGSILRALLFIIYINDMKRYWKSVR